MKDYNVENIIVENDDNVIVSPVVKKDVATTVLLIIGYLIAGAVIGFLTYMLTGVLISYNPNDNWAGLGIAVLLVLIGYGAIINIVPTILGAVSLWLVKKRKLSTTKKTLSLILTLVSIPLPIIYFLITMLIL